MCNTCGCKGAEGLEAEMDSATPVEGVDYMNVSGHSGFEDTSGEREKIRLAREMGVSHPMKHPVWGFFRNVATGGNYKLTFNNRSVNIPLPEWVDSNYMQEIVYDLNELNDENIYDLLNHISNKARNNPSLIWKSEGFEAEGMNDSLFNEAQHFFEHMEKASTNALSLMQMGAIEKGDYYSYIDAEIANMESRMRTYLGKSGMLNRWEARRLDIEGVDAPLRGQHGYRGRSAYEAEGKVRTISGRDAMKMIRRTPQQIKEDMRKNPPCEECGSLTTEEVRSGVEGTYEYVCYDDNCEWTSFPPHADYEAETFGADGSYAMSRKESFENNYVFPAIIHLEKLRNRLATMEGRNVMEGDYGPTDLDMNQRLSLTAANINEIIKEMRMQYLESNPVYDTEESDVVGFVGDGRQIGFLDAENDPDFDEEKADRNKDGKISDWERAVGNAVAKSIRETKENKGAENHAESVLVVGEVDGHFGKQLEVVGHVKGVTDKKGFKPTNIQSYDRPLLDGSVLDEGLKSNLVNHAESFDAEWVVEAVQQNINDRDFVNHAYKVLINGEAKTYEEKSMAIVETMNQNANNEDFTSFVEEELFNTEEFGAERRERIGKRYITRDNEGKFKKNVSIGRSLRADRRRKAKRVPKSSGQGDKGDYNGEDMSLKDSAKLGFGVGAGLLGFNLTLLGVATVGGFLLNRD